MTKWIFDKLTHGQELDDDRDFATVPSIDRDDLGIGRSLTGFIHLVDAILAAPPNPFIAAGRNADTDAASKVFWTYTAEGEFHLRAASGFLTTDSGNGGFTLDVERDGSWRLTFDGSDKVIGHEAGEAQIPPPPPSAGLIPITIAGSGPAFYDSTTDHINPTGPKLIDGGLGRDTFQGGIGDYMIGGDAGLLASRAPGTGNCAIYTKSAGSVLVDLQNGFGYGGNAEGNVYADMNQVRGSLLTNILIGNTTGSDLKSGGNNSVLISTGGNGFELRPDGRGNVLISTAGGDRLAFEPGKGWALGDDNIMLGFDPSTGDSIDIHLLTVHGARLSIAGGTAITTSNFHDLTATGYNPATGAGNISAYVRFDDVANDGTHVFFDPRGHVQAGGGYDLADLKFAHGLSVEALYAAGRITA